MLDRKSCYKKSLIHVSNDESEYFLIMRIFFKLPTSLNMIK